VTFQGRATTIGATLFVSLWCLLLAAVVHQKAQRLSTAAPVTATVAKVWSKRISKGGPTYFARLIFDRKQSDGDIVHCDVPDVLIGQPATVGAAIKVVPRSTTCWEPDIFCETCAASNNDFALVMLMVAAVSGLICFVQFWIILREKKPASSHSG
jgi:hypothetical protein